MVLMGSDAHKRLGYAHQKQCDDPLGLVLPRQGIPRVAVQPESFWQVEEETGKGLSDRHHALQEEHYALLAWLLGFTEPAIDTLEYGGTGQAFETPERNDPQALEAQLLRLRQLLH
ncbi:MAG TPA: hypothetical protein PLJ35_15340 [Anaerolineae bacterium]|nr:hypothetical protein [Anaerolineae bacterium]